MAGPSAVTPPPVRVPSAGDSAEVEELKKKISELEVAVQKVWIVFRSLSFLILTSFRRL